MHPWWAHTIELMLDTFSGHKAASPLVSLAGLQGLGVVARLLQPQCLTYLSQYPFIVNNLLQPGL